MVGRSKNIGFPLLTLLHSDGTGNYKSVSASIKFIFSFSNNLMKWFVQQLKSLLMTTHRVINLCILNECHNS